MIIYKHKEVINMKIYNVVYDYRGHIEVYPCANEKVALKKVRELSLQALTYEGI